MLVKTRLVKKFNWFWFLLPLVLFLCLSPLAYLILKNDSSPSGNLNLLSPLFGPPKPDLSQFLEVKTIPPLTFDYSKSTTVDSLSDQISYLVYDPKTLRVFAAKNQNQYFSPASFTKLLTAQVALDLFSPDQLFTATKTAVDKEPTVLGLKEGEQLTLSELIRGAISTSANDAAAVIAEGVATHYQQDPSFFSEIMNQKAVLLGMTQSHFHNPEGYDHEGQYSTLEDIARLVQNSQKYPEIISAGLLDRYDLEATATHEFYYLPNWNGLLNVYPGVNGLKIAYTKLAGYSSIVTCEREGVSVVAILIGADSIPERDLAASALLDAAYLAQKIKPIKLTKNSLQKRYQEWADLSSQIKATLTPTPQP